MEFTKNQMYIAVGAGVLLVLIFLGYLAWLNNQPPVLAKSEDRDSLTRHSKFHSTESASRPLL